MTDVRVVIVVGMHRAGTSALTRGLMSIGVDLGDDLLLPNATNPKGFWENRAIVEINDRLLSSLGHSWHSHGLVEIEPQAFVQANQLFFEVVQRIREYTSRYPVWGFKDPRSARLLPFWQAVLQHLECHTGYVIALRNPLSVARSLAARDGFAPQKSYLLWLEHYVCAFKYTRGCPVVVVDYDRLLEDPSRELDRVALHFGLSPALSREPAPEEYWSQFLERELRHTQFVAQDVSLDPCMLDAVTELYGWGYKLATDQISPDDEGFCQFLGNVDSICRNFAPALQYWHGLEVELYQVNSAQEAYREQIAQMQEACDRLGADVVARDARIMELTQALATQYSEVGRLGANVAARDARIVELTQALAMQHSAVGRLGADVAARDTRIVELTQALAMQQAHVGRLGADVAARDARIVELTQALAMQQAHVGRLGADVAARDARIVELTQALAMQQAHVGRLGADVAARDTRIVELTQALATQQAQVEHELRRADELARTLHALETSIAWRLTQPVRKILAKRSRLALYSRRFLQLIWGTIACLLPARLIASAHLRRHIKTVTASGLFDTSWYLSQNPEVAAAGLNPLVHYLRYGAWEGRNPNPVFDTAWYLAQNPEVAAAGLNPLVHYWQQGAQEQREPSALFDSAWYVAHTPALVPAGLNPLLHYLHTGWQQGCNPHPLFDTAFYLAHNPDVAQAGIPPLWHYLHTGWQQGCNPHPLFDTTFYLAHNPDVAQAGLNPLLHYLHTGWQQGCNPHPLFDTTFYLAHNPDVAQAGLNPLLHYLHTGWREGRNPHPLFDTTFYLAHNPDVAQAGLEPLWHYLHAGWQQGRQPNPVFDTAWYLAQNPEVAAAGLNPLVHYWQQGAQEQREPSALFDSAWYVAHTPDLAPAGLNPLLHYLHTGWRAGRNPHPLFDTAFYLAHNPDVAQAGLEPLWHYLHAGWQQGRQPNPVFDTAWYLAQNPEVAAAGLNPLVHYWQQGAQEQREPSALFDSAWYVAHTPDLAPAGLNPLLHYLHTGWRAGRNPHPLFDTAFYLAHNPDVAQAGLEPLWHYLHAGWQQGRQPNPVFDTAWYLAQNPEVAAAGLNPLVHYWQQGAQEQREPSALFDSAWYVAHTPDLAPAGLNPLLHYLHTGWRAGRNPHPLFDTAFYLAHNPDVAQAGLEPLWHYLHAGWQQGCNPHPLFDTAFYLAHNPDVAQAGLEPLWHYLHAGWQEGRQPNPVFDTAWYLAQNPEVAAAGLNPLVHYWQQGAQEQREPSALFDSAWYVAHTPDLAPAGLNPLLHYLHTGWRAGRNPHPLFDTAFYLAHNPDVAQAGLEPSWHYLHAGWQQGRNPHPLFDTVFYLAHNLDVVQAGLNPLLHYLHVGWQEGRNPHPEFDTSFYLEENPSIASACVNPLRHYVTFGQAEGRLPTFKEHAAMPAVTEDVLCRLMLEHSLKYHIHISTKVNFFMLEIAQWLHHALVELGQDATLIYDTLPVKNTGIINIVVAPHEFFYALQDVSQEERLRAAEDCVHVTTEQPGNSWFELSWLYASRGKLILDFNRLAVQEYRRRGQYCLHLQLGYHSLIDHWNKRSVNRDIDILFLGTFTKRRERIIASLSPYIHEYNNRFVINPSKVMKEGNNFLLQGQHKYMELVRTKILLNIHQSENAYFEWIRILEAIHNGAVVVTEKSTNYYPLEPGKHFIEFDPQAIGGEPITALLANEDRRKEIAHNAYQFVYKNMNFKENLRKILPEINNCHNLVRKTEFNVAHQIEENHDNSYEKVIRKFANQIDFKVSMLEKKMSLTEMNLQRSLQSIRYEAEMKFPDESLCTEIYYNIKPDISVIITAYDYERYLHAVVENVLSSKYVTPEIIIVNDASPDKTEIVLQKIISFYNNNVPIKVINHGLNKGLPAARNSGISAARCEYVFILDADNLIYPSCLYKLKKALDESGEDSAFAYPIIERFGFNPGLLSAYFWDPDLLVRENYIDAMAMLKKSKWHLVGGYMNFTAEKIGGWEDYALWLSFAERGWHGIQVPEILARYRTHEGSMVHAVAVTSEQNHHLLVSKFDTLYRRLQRQ